MDRNKLTFFVCIALMVAFAAATGAYLLCAHSGGSIETANFTCIQLHKVGLCEHNGVTYALPPSLNFTFAGGLRND